MKTTKYYKKQKLYGAGHPQLPNQFGVKGTKKQINQFFKDHETTHARFIETDKSEFSDEDIEFMDIFDCDL